MTSARRSTPTSRPPSILIALLVMLWAASTAAQDSEITVPFEITGTTMGPIKYTVVIAQHPETVTPTQLQSNVQATLDRVNNLMSTYLPESDVSRFNQSESTDFQTIDAETATVVARALEISEQTKGAFDITVGPAVNLWNFGPDKSAFQIPTEEAIEAVKKRVGYQQLELRLDPPAIRKSIPDLQIDLSAIAKGYAVDQVAKSLDDASCLNFMVEVGGEVFARGNRFAGGPWRVGVERPTEIGREIGSVAALSDRAMATSGDYRNFEQFDGKRYSHTIDPKTCKPVTHGLASACVVAGDCITADAIATAVMVLGAGQGAELCNRLGYEYLLAERDSDQGDKLSETVSTGFPLKAIEPTSTASPGSVGILPTFIGAALVFGLVILAMAVGSIFGNKPVQGSCGGLANMTNEDGETSCGVCSKPVTDCVEQGADA